MKGNRARFVGSLVILLLGVFVLWSEIPELLSYKKLSGNYRAFLMRYEEDTYSTRPSRHKHALVRITFADGKQVDFRSPRNGRFEWISADKPLEILVRQPEGPGSKPEYEVNQYMHLYLDLVIWLTLVAVGIWSLYTCRKPTNPVIPLTNPQ